MRLSRQPVSVQTGWQPVPTPIRSHMSKCGGCAGRRLVELAVVQASQAVAMGSTVQSPVALRVVLMGEWMPGACILLWQMHIDVPLLLHTAMHSNKVRCTYQLRQA